MKSCSIPLVVSIIWFCSTELTQISTGNAALVPEEESVLETLRETFNQIQWTGDPCESVDWITCSRTSEAENVWELNLEKRNLTGTIPADVAKLRQLRELVLTGNSLYGLIPDLSNMTNLELLDLSENNLSGRIPDTAAFTNISEIALNGNNLTGGIPASIFKHNKLKILSLRNNPLGGSIPDLSELTSLQSLDLTQIQANGSFPVSIQTIGSLTSIQLGNNPQLSGSIPDMNHLISLKVFTAGFCALSGSLPDLTNIGGLETLLLALGALLPDLKNSQALDSLDLQMNDFSGTIPAALFRRESLRYLNLNDNPRLSGRIPDTSMLAAIEKFYANNCNLSGELPSLRQNAKLQYIGLWNNRLTTFPSDLQNSTNLVQIDVHNNAMSGPLPDLPPGFTQLTTGVYLTSLIFSNNSFSGGIPNSWSQLTNLEEMFLDSNKLSGVIQRGVGNLTSLKHLNLRNNLFSGPLPEDFGDLQNLQTLDLRNNQFIGTVPRTLAELPNLHTLLLDDNRFTGLPEIFLQLNKSQLNISYTNNPNLNFLYGPSGLSSGTIVGVVVGVLGTGVGIAVLAIMLYRRKRKGMYKSQLSKADMPKSAQYFSLKQIKAITQNFTTLIGKGGFGPVYYGKLPDGKEVAVKVRATDSKQGAIEFLNEVRLLSRLHHRNLVSLVGYCLEGQQQILVYVYMSQGTLHDHLYHTGFGSNPSHIRSDGVLLCERLSWKKRLDIAIDAARGLEYLHKDCNPPVIHRDVKTSNILLTEKLQAKVADLGISKQADELDSREGVSTVIKGTFGYLDPEYFVRHRLTTKSDVYSFGMVLLEIVTGKRPQTQKFPDSPAKNLIDWVRGAVNTDQFEAIVDPALRDEYDKGGMLKVVRTALLCVLPKGGERPEMGDIVRTLTQALHMEGEYLDNSSSGSQDIFPFPSQGTAPLTSTSGASSSDTLYGDYFHPSWNTDPR